MTEVNNMFDEKSYVNVRKPLADAETLPAWCYTSAEFFDREIENIFLTVWNFVGHVSQFPAQGDYLTIEIANTPIIVIRGSDGIIRGYVNSCRHRGTKLLEGKGNVRAIRCPYHSWTYSLAGDLVGCPAMERTNGFNREEFGLLQLRVEVFMGFVFLNLDQNAISLETYVGDLREIFLPYVPEAMLCSRVIEYDVRCNWKIHVENAMEAYHVPTVHSGSIAKQRREPLPPLETKGEYVALYTKHQPGQGSRAVLPGDEAFPTIEGLYGRAAEGTYFLLVYPTLMFGCTTDCIWWHDVRPYSSTHCKVLVGSCFPKTTMERSDFERIVANYYRRWDKSVPEDNDISEMQQRGIDSRITKEGRFSYMEPLVHTIDNWVLDRLSNGADRQQPLKL